VDLGYGAPVLVQRAVSEGWEGAARCPSCSQNAHDETVLILYAQERAASATPLQKDKENWRALVGRAHSRTDQATL